MIAPCPLSSLPRPPQAALESMRRKLEVYKRENASLLASYDTWLKQTMAGRQPVVGASP